MRDLPVYVGMYQESDSVIFMKPTREENISLIRNTIKMNSIGTKSKELEINFNPENNQIDIRPLYSIKGNFWVSIKDIDSNACIYGFKMQEIEPGQSFWCVPIPKEFYDFYGDKNFSGFGIEIYSNRGDEIPLIFEECVIKKRINKKKLPSNPYINFD
ncbi:hypothetical protein ACPF8X_45040, partial [Streptomyces sp. G35A]